MTERSGRVSMASLLGLLCCAGTMVWLCGCEPNEGSKGLSLTPSSVTLGADSNTVSFTVGNVASNGLGLPVSWSVTDTSLGTIVHHSGLVATYQRTTRNGENTVVVRDQYKNEGYATVRQVSNLGTTATLALAGTTSLTTSTNTTTITVSGGQAPFDWYVDNESVGTVSHANGSSAVYTGKSNGSNTIHVRDANGAAASIGVTQTDDPTPSSTTGTTGGVSVTG